MMMTNVFLMTMWKSFEATKMKTTISMTMKMKKTMMMMMMMMKKMIQKLMQQSAINGGMV